MLYCSYFSTSDILGEYAGMCPITSVLAPKVETAAEYKYTLEQLRKTALDFIERIEHDAISEKELDEYYIIMDSVLVYQEFAKAFKKGKGLFMTWDELRQEFWRFEHLDEIVKSLLTRGLLKEVRIDWPPKAIPLCPFCGKLSAYPIRRKRFFFFAKISAWSCANETCHMYKKQYLL